MTTATSKSNTSTATDSSANSKAAQVEAPFTEKATEAAHHAATSILVYSVWKVR